VIVDAGRGAVAFDGANIWVANRGDGTVSRFSGALQSTAANPKLERETH
jgi:hypothetical protein